MIRKAIGTSLGLSALFMVVYSSTNLLAAQHEDLGTWVYAWERHIPFVPWLIVPYMSIDLLFVIAPFFCVDERELKLFARRIVFTVLVAGACFALFPLRLAWERPEFGGVLGWVYGQFTAMDQPHNLLPSLHIALRTILAEHFARHTRGSIRIASHIWFSVIGFSTLLVWQHHMVDIVGGFLLALVCFFLVRERNTSMPWSASRVLLTMAVALTLVIGLQWAAVLTEAIDPRATRWLGLVIFVVLPLGVVVQAVGRTAHLSVPSPHERRIGRRYQLLSGLLLGLALGGAAFVSNWFLWLLWPCAATLLISLTYFGGADFVYGKRNGRLPLASRLVLAPVLIGQWLSWLHYARHSHLCDKLTDHVWIGRRVTDAQATALLRQGVIAVLDTTCEFSEARPFCRDAAYCNVAIPDLTAPSPEQLRQAVDFITEHSKIGVVYVHCKAGYSRTAAVAGGYLLASGLAADASTAEAMLYAARPGMVIRPEASEAIARSAQAAPRSCPV